MKGQHASRVGASADVQWRAATRIGALCRKAGVQQLVDA